MLADLEACQKGQVDLLFLYGRGIVKDPPELNTDLELGQAHLGSNVAECQD